MTLTELEKYSSELRKTERKIWEDLEETLYQRYLGQGYYQWWARMKAARETLELRSAPKNPIKMRIPADQTTQGDLD